MPLNIDTHYDLGDIYKKMGRDDKAIATYKVALKLASDPRIYDVSDDTVVHRRILLEKEIKNLAAAQPNIKEADRLAREQRPLEEEQKKHQALQNIQEADRVERMRKFFEKQLQEQEKLEAFQSIKEADRLARERKLLKEERKKLEVSRLAGENRQRQQQQPSYQQPVPGGTGFLFSSKDYIITNYHIVKGKHSIKAKFTNGDVIEADIVSKDAKNDIAILKLKTPSSTTSRELQFGDSSKARMGERVFTIGFPASFVLGERPKYTEGVISAVTGIKDDPTVFQITVPIQPGNSGGPLFNQRGEVIGITTASLSLRATEVLGAVPQNINYALKSSFVKNLLTSIPESLLSNRGIVVVPKGPENSLADFIEAVTGNVVLIEAKE
jgi:S1-C subfamily serine protease